MIDFLFWEGYAEINQSVYGGVGTERIRLRLLVLNCPSIIRWKQTLEMKNNVGLLNGQDTGGLQVSQAEDVDLYLIFTALDHIPNVFGRWVEIIVKFNYVKAD